MAPWAERARVLQIDGSFPLPAAGSSADRFIAAYVVDHPLKARTRGPLVREDPLDNEFIWAESD